MRYIELKTAVFSIIDENDSYRATKELHLRNWCRAFLNFFKESDENHLTFFLDVLRDPECWIETDTIHGIQLNRRKVARKMMEVQSWSCKLNPLDENYRFQIACWCCLEETIVLLFENFKCQNKMMYAYASDVKNLVMSLQAGVWYDRLTHYWIYIVGGYACDLNLEGKHIYEYGIYIALDMCGECYDRFIGYVEAVEYFWHKIKQLPERTLSTHRKAEIFMRTTLRASENDCSNHPEILEFCISQISIDKYPELMKRDFAQSFSFRTLNVLRYNRRFDLIQKLFDCLEPNYVLEDTYYELLRMLILFDVEKHSKFYLDEAVKLLTHIWMKQGFDRHRSAVLRAEVCSSESGDTLLMSLVKKNYGDTVFLILDQASPEQKDLFMNSGQASNIRSIFKARNDQHSLMKLSMSDENDQCQ